MHLNGGEESIRDNWQIELCRQFRGITLARHCGYPVMLNTNSRCISGTTKRSSCVIVINEMK